MIDKIKDVVSKMIDNKDTFIYDITYKKEGKKMILRVLLDNPNGISMDECASVNRQLGEYLEEKDLIDKAYSIEVNSPGIDRPLNEKRHYEMSLGKNIEIKLFSPVDGKKTFVGKLEGLTDEYVVIENDKGISFKIDVEKICKANIKY